MLVHMPLFFNLGNIELCDKARLEKVAATAYISFMYCENIMPETLNLKSKGEILWYLCLAL